MGPYGWWVHLELGPGEEVRDVAAGEIATADKQSLLIASQTADFYTVYLISSCNKAMR